MKPCKPTRSLVRLLATTMLLVFLTSGGPAAGGQNDQATLRGLTSITVNVIVHSELEKAGLSSAQLRTQLELRLRTLGITVPTDHEQAAILNLELGGKSVALGSVPPGMYTFSSNLFLMQPVVLTRDPAIRTLATTWEWRNFGLLGWGRSAAGAQDSVRAGMDAFLNDYLAVNPRQLPDAGKGVPE